MELLPVTWPFFGMCPNDTDYYLYPYDNLTIEDCTKDYRLRVMVNVGPNCFHFKYLDDRAFNFFFNQVSMFVCLCVFVYACVCVCVCVKIAAV